MMRRSFRPLRVVGLLLPFAVWELNAQLRPSPLTPTLGTIIAAMARSLRDGTLWYNAQQTIPVALIGLAIGAAAGVFLGFLLAANRLAEAVIEPLLAGSYPVPKLALYPLFVLIFGLGNLPTVLLIALECMYPIAYNTYQGARSLDRNLVWLTRNAEMPRWRRFLGLDVPNALPSIFTGLRIAVPLMVIVVVVVEMIGRSRGLGFMIKDAGRQLEPETALGVVIILGIFGFLVDLLVQWITGRVVFWERGHGLGVAGSKRRARAR